MKNKLVLIALLTSVISFSQISDVTLQISTAKTDLFLKEIFKNCPEFIPTDIENYEELVNKVTVIISTKNEKSLAELPLLSQVPIKTKCNYDLVYENSNFEIGTFNPIKYFFNFYSLTDMYYRVDGTNLIIKIRAI